MKKNYARYYNSLFSVMPVKEQSQVEKFLALEYHPRQRQPSLSTLGHILLTTSLMY